MAGVLAGIRVLDLGRFIAVPFCGMLLADLGAEVIRIERKGGGEDRFLGFLSPAGYSYGFSNQNRNKKGITLNFEKNEKAKTILFELAKNSDVIIQNFSPEAARSVGVTYEDFKVVKPDIIYAQVSAFGHSGPYQHRIGFDQIAKAMSGAMAISGFPDIPTKEQQPHVDYMTASLTALGIVSALYHKEKTGQGQMIETSLLQTAVTFTAPIIGEWEIGRKTRPQTGNRTQFIGPSDLYQTKDGKWIMLAIITNSIWRRFCKYIKREDLLNDYKFKTDYDRWENRDIIDPIVTQWVASRTAQEVITEAEKIPIPAGICYDQTEVYHDPQVQASEMFTEVPLPDGSGKIPVTNCPLQMSTTPLEIVRSFPSVGQHNEEIYTGILGYNRQQLTEMERQDII
jgi:crotonobetainyl-CoA:carnitine CoA-transferase CaiB-like acyl-CoA transferase